jgi:hypothetical protein
MSPLKIKIHSKKSRQEALAQGFNSCDQGLIFIILPTADVT